MTHATTVGIVGAGPAGLVLGTVLQRSGIDCVIFEQHSRSYVEQRARAGVLEDRTLRILEEHGLAGGPLARDARHTSCEFRSEGQRFSVPYGRLAGEVAHYVYPQQELVADLVAAFLAGGGDLRFECPVARLGDVDGARPTIRTTSGEEVECDHVAGADGSHGSVRASLPTGGGVERVRRYPYRWLTVLAEAPPSTEEIIYALHEDGFAGHMLRSATVSRYYLQVDPGDTIEDWPGSRIWEQLHHRLSVGDGWSLTEGPVIETGILEMRTFVRSPMRHGQVFLLGDAAHVITPAGGKGMNLAIADADELARALKARLHGGAPEALDGYSATRLPRVWQAQQFSDWLLHLVNTAPPGPDRAFEHALRVARLDELRTCDAVASWFADNYVGVRTGTTR